MSYTYTNKIKGRQSFAEGASRIVVFPPPAGDGAEELEVTELDSGAEMLKQLAECEQVARVNHTHRFLLLKIGDDTQAENAILEEAAKHLTYKDVDGNERYFLPHECTVQFNDDSVKAGDEKMREMITALGSKVITKQRTPGYYTITVPADQDLFEFLNKLNKEESVKFAEPSEFSVDDELPETQPADDLLSAESEIERLWGMKKIQMPEAWKVPHNDDNHVFVCVIDTGADLDHPDLKNNLADRNGEDWDFAEEDDIPEDSGSHGTHVAGTAVAVRNQLGVVGVAPNVKFIPLRINLNAGMNQNRADAINFIADKASRLQGKYVINLSWRMSGDMTAVSEAIRNATRAGAIVIAAAGNADRDIDRQPQYPGAYPEVVAVASTEQRDGKSSFSNYGRAVAIAAPGSDIYSTIPPATYGMKSGTSMASPHVAGLASVVWSLDAQMSAAQVIKRLQFTADSIERNNPNYPGLLGSGRINAFRAVTSPPMTVVQNALFSIYNGQLCRMNLPDNRQVSILPGQWGGFVSMTALENSLYIIQNDKLHRVNPQTGTRTVLAGDWPGFSVMTAVGDKLYILQGGKLHQFDPRTNQNHVLRNSDDWSKVTAMTAVNGRLYLFSGNLHRVDLETGMSTLLTWDRLVNLTGFASLATIAEQLYMLHGDRLYELTLPDNNHNQLTSRIVSRQFQHGPTSLTSKNDLLYAIDEDIVYGVNPATGQRETYDILSTNRRTMIEEPQPLIDDEPVIVDLNMPRSTTLTNSNLSSVDTSETLDDRIRVVSPSVFPNRCIGHIEVTALIREGGRTRWQSWTGSGSLLSDYTVLTAGHVVKDGNNQFYDIRELRFIPGRNHSSMPYGQFNWSYIRAVCKDVRDWALISLAQPAGHRTGFFGSTTKQPISQWQIDQDEFAHLGFPGDHADEMWIDESGHCTGIYRQRQLKTDIDAAHGQSGGPLLIGWGTSNPQVVASLVWGPNSVEDPNYFMPGYETSNEDTWMYWLNREFGNRHADDRYGNNVQEESDTLDIRAAKPFYERGDIATEDTGPILRYHSGPQANRNGASELLTAKTVKYLFLKPPVERSEPPVLDPAAVSSVKPRG